MIEAEEHLPISITGYFPLETLTPNLITTTGIAYILSDRSVGKGTIELLRRSEEKLARNKKYEEFWYILEEHDPEKVYAEFFESNRAIGKAHLSILIQEDLKQTYAELVAAYCCDKRLPYLIALIILEDYKQTCGALKYYYSREKSIGEADWRAPKTNICPPVNYSKMFRANKESNPDLNDGYVLATLRDYGYNKSMTVKVLKTSKYILMQKLMQLNVIRDDGSLDKWKIERLLEKKVGSVIPEGRDVDYMTADRKSTQCIMPPTKKNSDEQAVTAITEDTIRNACKKYRNDTHKVSKTLGIPYVRVSSIAHKLTKEEEIKNNIETVEDPIEGSWC